MARLLTYMSTSQGHVYPPVGTLLELAQRGHEVHVRTRAQDVERFTDLGLRTAPIDPRIEEIECDDWRARTQSGALVRLVDFFAACGELEVPDFRRAIDDVQPDLLIVDVNCLAAGYLAETTGLPWAQYCPHPPPIRSRDVPAHGLGWAPGRGRLGHLRDHLTVALGDKLVPRVLRPLNAQRMALGLPANRHWDDQYLKSGRFILFTAEPYEYPRSDWPASVRLVGPGTWEPPVEPRDWLATETRPIILVTASTALQDDAKLITTALEAFAGDDLALVATTAAHDPTAFDAPPNARVAQSLPHTPIITRAACVISHGGMGITQKALAAGTPLCVVPFCRDQFDVGRRVELADAGVRLHHRRLSPDRLRRAVRQAMTKREGAEAVGRAFAAAGGSAAAADAVEELLPNAHSRSELATNPRLLPL
jgi:UDP:flavonoid glycosyltransferase YjiC (YdhE family)